MWQPPENMFSYKRKKYVLYIVSNDAKTMTTSVEAPQCGNRPKGGILDPTSTSAADSKKWEARLNALLSLIHTYTYCLNFFHYIIIHLFVWLSLRSTNVEELYLDPNLSRTAYYFFWGLAVLITS